MRHREGQNGKGKRKEPNQNASRRYQRKKGQAIIGKQLQLFEERRLAKEEEKRKKTKVEKKEEEEKKKEHDEEANKSKIKAMRSQR